MVVERRQRTLLYCGPLTECTRRELPGLERKGGFVVEAKIDGCWCALHVNQGGSGSHRFESRVGLEFGGDQLNGLADLDLDRVPAQTILVGELETASEAATKTYRQIGYRRLFLFDVIQWSGQDLRNHPFRERTNVLRKLFWNLVPKKYKNKQLVLVEQVFSGFRSFYDKIVESGGEGIVIKPLDSSARPTRADGKTAEWLRCKPMNTVDYVVMDPAWTEKKELSAKLGLWRDGKPRCVLQSQLPDLELNAEGRLKQEGMVVELYGREVFASGALRHANFRRWREDKVPEQCTGEVHRLGEVENNAACRKSHCS